MLSQAAFNAFLKTLEEPPAHAIFILATTEKHKILPTIISRCQVFDFHRITVPDVVELGMVEDDIRIDGNKVSFSLIFSNRYETRHAKDLTYFILFVWKQLALDQQRDELFLGGDLPDKDELLATLRKYVQVVCVINPSASFNRAPLTQIKGIPFDLITYYLG